MKMTFEELTREATALSGELSHAINEMNEVLEGKELTMFKVGIFTERHREKLNVLQGRLDTVVDELIAHHKRMNIHNPLTHIV